jgi:APA family basic amino acid/polyamine antiporter
VPVNAVLLETRLSLVALLLGAFDRILAYIIFSVVIFQGLTVWSLFRMSPPVRRWWYPAAPIVFLVFCAAIALLILAHDPLPAFLGIGIVLCGEPVRRVISKRSGSRDIFATERS